MSDILICEDFKNLIPPISKEEFEQLEQNILNYGIKDSLVVAVYPNSGGNVLIDGHNRYEISKKHGGLEFKKDKIEFESKESATEWIIQNQLGRRNLSSYDRSLLALKLKPVIQERAEKNLHLSDGKGSKKSAKVKAIDTREELSKIAGVSHDTIHKVEVIEREAPEEASRIRKGETTINKVYHEIIKPEGVKSIIRNAEKEHESYESYKNGNIVSFDSAKNDKDNIKILSFELLKLVVGGADKFSTANFKYKDTGKLFSALCVSDKVAFF